ncbi:MAG: hypothetical protein OEZ01_04525, partial [Candidatus Heimdallarchaeota archaeon]|nr:hypothetical protein [Candidatus Heimdallarchaeota archaeon]
MKYLIRISHAHPHVAEIEMETFFKNYHLNWLTPMLCTVSCTSQMMDDIIQLSSCIKIVVENPIITNIENDEIVGLDDLIIPQSSRLVFNNFKVKITRVHKKINNFNTEKMIVNVARQVYSCHSHLEIDLTNPDVIFQVLYWGNNIALGWLYKEKEYREIAYREPKNWDYFGGGSMKSHLSRLLINLLYPLDATILDPFSGHGGFLREIAETGSYAIGIEVNKRIIFESRANSRKYGLDQNIGLIHGNSLYPPFRKSGIDKIVTDPPYARQTTTVGLNRDV